MVYARIVGTGGYLPQKVVTNKELEQRVDTTDAWIVERTGICQRHIAVTETTVDMSYFAAQQALQAGGLAADEIGLIIVATSTPDKVFPSTACLLQKALQINNCVVFDLNAACSGFIYALVTAQQFIENGMVQHALVVGSEIMSRVLDWTDRSTCVLFGDGAGAVVLSRSDQPGIHSAHLHGSGVHDELLYVNGCNVDKDCQNPYLTMRGNEIFRYAVKHMGALVEEVLAANKLEQDSIDWLIPHQANIRIISAMAKKLNLPMERVITTVSQHANTSAASLPLALNEGIRSHKIKKGDRLLLEAFGAGLTWGAALVTY